jgi:hypothetical protein
MANTEELSLFSRMKWFTTDDTDFTDKEPDRITIYHFSRERYSP